MASSSRFVAGKQKVIFGEANHEDFPPLWSESRSKPAVASSLGGDPSSCMVILGFRLWLMGLLHLRLISVLLDLELLKILLDLDLILLLRYLTLQLCLHDLGGSPQGLLLAGVRC